MLASLPMYDRAELRGATDRYWTALRAELGEGPPKLRRGGDHWDDWHSANLLLSQTCGFPFRARLHGQVQLVGTPIYDLPDVAPGYYRSALVVRGDDPRASLADFTDATLARNDAMSQSGWAAPEAEATRIGFSFRGRCTDTGSHAASARLVATGGADIAAIDAVTWTLMQRHDPMIVTQLRVLSHTRPTPGLPYITAPGRDLTPVQAAIPRAIANLSGEDRDALLLVGFCQIAARAYLDVWTPPKT